MTDTLDLQALIARLIHQIQAKTPDLAADIYRQSTEAYRSPVRFEAEREHLFLRTPVFGGWSAEIPNPGDYKTLDIAGASLLLVRNQAGQPSASSVPSMAGVTTPAVASPPWCLRRSFQGSLRRRIPCFQ